MGPKAIGHLKEVLLYIKEKKLYKQHNWQGLHSSLYTEYRKQNAKNITYH